MPATADDPCFAEKIRALIAEHAPETRARGIVFHQDFDPALVFLERGAGAGGSPSSGGSTEEDAEEKALRGLLRFVIETVPDDCEVYVALARPAVPVALVGAAELTLRWQVAGDRRAGAEAEVVPLRPRLGDAQTQIVGKSAQALRADFRAAGWPLDLEAIQGGEEIWLRADVS